MDFVDKVDLNHNGHKLVHYIVHYKHLYYTKAHYICVNCNVVFYDDAPLGLVIIEDMHDKSVGYINKYSIKNQLTCEEIIIKQIIE